MTGKDNRRSFLEKMLTGGAGIVISAMGIQSCQSGNGGAEKDDLDVTACNDLSKVSEEEVKKRNGLGYVEVSPMSDKYCNNCQLYLPPKEGQTCGGCALFKGPVFEEGYCTYWAPIVG